MWFFLLQFVNNRANFQKEARPIVKGEMCLTKHLFLLMLSATCQTIYPNKNKVLFQTKSDSQDMIQRVHSWFTECVRCMFSLFILFNQISYSFSTRIIQSARSSQLVNQLSSPNEFQLTEFKDILREAMPDILKDCFENYALSMGWKLSSPRMSNIVSISSYFAFSCYTMLCPVDVCFQIIYKLDLDKPLQ